LHNTPVHFVHDSVEFTRLCAMYALAEVALVTPLADGMNLVAKEYVACKRELPGVLVLSEFAGAAEELFNATLVNPYDARGVADAIAAALQTSAASESDRMGPMRQRVMKFDADWWAKTFLGDLASRPALEDQPATAAAEIAQLGNRFAEALREGQRVAFFLDYDGTLREIERDPVAARPNPAVWEVLGRLGGIANLDVTIVSGRQARDLDAWFSNTPFTLLAEHGADIRRGGQREWDRLDPHITYGWKQDILPLLRLYEDSTPGSFIEEKRAGLVWHYRKAEPQLGAWKASALAEELSTILASEPVQIRHGKKIVELAAAQVSKGAAIARLLDETHYDIALCAGDDQTDESMFTLDVANLVTVKVGRGSTAARVRLRTPAEFRGFLRDVVPTAVAERYVDAIAPPVPSPPGRGLG
jgi:trehalose 6-phosphate synthase/phosphatase